MRKRQLPSVLIGWNDHIANCFVAVRTRACHRIEMSRDEPVAEQLRVVEQRVAQRVGLAGREIELLGGFDELAGVGT
jgi:hypothetical protein